MKNLETNRLVATRSGVDTYRLENGRGAELLIGTHGAKGAFSPLELLQAALAGCTALSAETQLRNKLGDDFEAAVSVNTTFVENGTRAAALAADLDVDMSALDEEAAAKLITFTERVIERLCAVKRTLNTGAEAVATVHTQMPRAQLPHGD